MIINNGKILIDDKPNEILKKGSNTYNKVIYLSVEEKILELKKNIIENKITDDVKVIESFCVVKTHNSKNIKKIRCLFKKKFNFKALHY